MKSIRNKISRPYIILIILAYTVTFMIFNSVLIIYKNDSDRRELERVATSINSILELPENRPNQGSAGLPQRNAEAVTNPHVEEIKGFMMESIQNSKEEIREDLLENANGNPKKIGLVNNNVNDERIQEAAESLEILMITSSIAKLADNVIFAVINENNEVIISNATDENIISTKFEYEFNEKMISIIDDVKEGEVKPIGHIFNRKYFTYKHLNSWLQDYKILYISTSNFANDIIITMDIVLLILSIATIIIAMFLGRVISKTIAKPLETLSYGASQIGKGNYILLTKDESSEEIYLLTKQINSMSRSLKKYDEAQRKLLQNASHELRTPLMSIQGYAEGVEAGIFKDPRKIAKHITEESKRMNRLVEGLLTLSHIDNDEYGKNIQVINLSDMAKEYLQRIQGLAVKQNKKVDLIIENDEIPVFIDEDLMAQVFMNIIGNGLRYGETKVEVRINKIHEDGLEKAIIVFKDDGGGIPENELPFVFDRFYKGKNGNHGLGLAIVKSVVDYMNGEIKAYNENNHAVFEIILPTAQV